MYLSLKQFLYIYIYMFQVINVRDWHVSHGLTPAYGFIDFLKKREFSFVYNIELKYLIK